MRPLPGEEPWAGRGSADRETPLMTPTPSSHQMSFFVADEAAIESYLEQPSVPRARDARKTNENVHASSSVPRSVHHNHSGDKDNGSCYSPISRGSALTRSPASIVSLPQTIPSRPMTPIMLGTSSGASLMSSPSSKGESLAGSLSEHAISFEDEESALPETSSSMMDSGSAPQLVMPSIKMPSRRPFTEQGKNLGRLKVMIAGDTGVGKTSLCKAIVQACEHIVHVDPIAPEASSRRSSKATVKNVARRTSSDTTTTINEIYASTKPYPEWWSELSDARAIHRRKSLGDVVLDRNICFVDTPGFAVGASVLEAIVPCVDYVEAHLNKVATEDLNASEMLNMLGGSGGFQVHVVLYMIHRSLKPADIEYLRRLAPLTNIVPLLAYADKLHADEVTRSKDQIVAQLHDAGIQSFNFVPALGPAPSAGAPSIPYAISSATETDHDVMDASLLMSPEYVQPLIPTELSVLVEQLFSPSGSSWLRHSAAKKYIQWRSSSNPSKPKSLYQPLHDPVAKATLVLNGENGALIEVPGCGPLARIRAQQEARDTERLHLADWAADLQRSLVAERAHYEAMARGERATWLTEKLNECVKDGTLVPVSKSRDHSKKRRSRQCHGRRTVRHQDPLGLLQAAADIKIRGWYALEVLSGLGLIGGVAYLLMRQQWRVEPVQFRHEWTIFLGLEI